MSDCELTVAPEEWDAHVATCPACQEDLESFAQLEGLGALVAEEPLPEGFTERLLARLDATPVPLVVREIPTRRAPVRFGRTFLAAAACLLLLLGGMLLWEPAAAPSPPRLVVGLAGATPPAVAASPAAEARVVERAAAVAPGQTLVTASGEGASSVLTAGGAENQVRVGPDTELRVGRVDDTGAELQLSRGRVWVTEESVRMIVQTPHLTVIPLGTEYEAILDDAGTQVVVYEGSVKVVGADGTSKVLQADQEIAVGPSAPLATAAPRQVRGERRREAWHRWNQQVQVPGERGRRRPVAPGEVAAAPPPQWLQQRWGRPGVRHPLERKLQEVRAQAASGQLDPETARRREARIQRQMAELERWQQGSLEERRRMLREKEQKLRELEASGEVPLERLRRYREILERKRAELGPVGWSEPDGNGLAGGPGPPGGDPRQGSTEGAVWNEPAAGDEPPPGAPDGAPGRPDWEGAPEQAPQPPDGPPQRPGWDGPPEGAPQRPRLQERRARLERFLREKEAKLRELEAAGQTDPATLRRYRQILAQKRLELQRLDREWAERRAARGPLPTPLPPLEPDAQGWDSGP